MSHLCFFLCLSLRIRTSLSLSLDPPPEKKNVSEMNTSRDGLLEIKANKLTQEQVRIIAISQS